VNYGTILPYAGVSVQNNLPHSARVTVASVSEMDPMPAAHLYGGTQRP